MPQPYRLPRSLERRHGWPFEKNSSRAAARSDSGMPRRSAHTVKITSSEVCEYGASAIMRKVRSATLGSSRCGGSVASVAELSGAIVMKVSK
jgi:hypothetical protein